MRNVLALLGAGLLAGCCLMHFHVPITEQTQANARTFGSLGQRLLPEDTPPERITAFRQCLSEAYMEHYGEGEAGTAREREDGYALFWQTVMAAAPTYDHLATYDIHVRGRKRYEADPHSFVEAGRAWSRIVFERCGAGVFPDEDRYRMPACSRVFPHGVTRRRGFRRRRAFWTTWGRRPQPARNFHKQSARRSRKETVCANVQKHRIP